MQLASCSDVLYTEQQSCIVLVLSSLRRISTEGIPVVKVCIMANLKFLFKAEQLLIIISPVFISEQEAAFFSKLSGESFFFLIRHHEAALKLIELLENGAHLFKDR